MNNSNLPAPIKEGHCKGKGRTVTAKQRRVRVAAYDAAVDRLEDDSRSVTDPDWRHVINDLKRKRLYEEQRLAFRVEKERRYEG